jgi:hypothetical protein
MSNYSKKINMLIIIIILAALLISPSVAIANDNLKCQVFCPDFKNNSLINLSLTVYNDHNHDISFNKITIAYMLPYLNFKGPYVITQAHTVPANSSITFTVNNFKIGTTSPVGTIVPIAVLFWDTYFTGGYERGGGAGAGLRIR